MVHERDAARDNHDSRCQNWERDLGPDARGMYTIKGWWTGDPICVLEVLCSAQSRYSSIPPERLKREEVSSEEGRRSGETHCCTYSKLVDGRTMADIFVPSMVY